MSAGTWPTPTTLAGVTTRRVLTLPLLAYAGIPYEFVTPVAQTRRSAG